MGSANAEETDVRLLLIRHAIAQDREAFRQQGGLEDGERPLVDKGRARMKRGARGLRRYAGGVQQLATSPYVRAASTARILVKRAGFPKALEIDALLPDRHPRELLAWLAQSRPNVSAAKAAHPIIAAVGHEPHLSRVIAWCTTGQEEPLGELKKGGACLLRFDAEIASGQASIEWLLKAGQLRSFGRCATREG
jgi:phosphohistidine phosphatase SixA